MKKEVSMETFNGKFDPFAEQRELQKAVAFNQTPKGEKQRINSMVTILLDMGGITSRQAAKLRKAKSIDEYNRLLVEISPVS